MPVFLKIDERSLVEDLQQSVVEVLFEKSDGSQRLLKCTLQPNFIRTAPFLSNEEKQQRADFVTKGAAPGTKVIHVWAIEENAWRSFRLDKVLSCQQTAW